jgi:signal transduction histidine kinase
MNVNADREAEASRDRPEAAEPRSAVLASSDRSALEKLVTLVAPMKTMEEFADERARLEATQRAMLNILDDSQSEKLLLKDNQKAVLNVLEDSAGERERLEATQRAMLNILDDSQLEKVLLEDNQKAVLNVLEDSAGERERLEATQRAMLNILDDSQLEKVLLEDNQKAVLNILEDLDAEKATVRTLNAGLEARVEERTADLEQANRNLEAFSYSVAHDLRTPLRSLSGFSEALLEDYGERLDEAGREYAERIQAASQQMSKLIDDLLHLSRVSRAEMRLEALNLSAEVAGIAAELRRSEPDRRVRLVIQEAVWVTADRPLIRTVVQNLLDNAWKFTSGRDEALIEFGGMRVDNGRICCYVRDNGAGFDPAYVDKLFRPFERLHSAREFPGTGVGLASVQRIVQRHGGRTWAEGAVDHGASFYFTMDAKETS